MIEIFKTVKKIFDTNHANESKEFKQGFELCFNYFEIGFKKNPQYNLLLRNNELEKRLEHANIKLAESNEKLAKLEKKFTDTLNSVDIIAEMNEENVNLVKRRKKIRLKMYSVLFSDKSDSEKVEYFKGIMCCWNQ